MLKKILSFIFACVLFNLNAFALTEEEALKNIEVSKNTTSVFTQTKKLDATKKIDTTTDDEDSENTNLSVKQLAIVAAEREYKNNKTIENRNKLLLNYEKLIELTCMKDFYKNLGYNKDATSKECKEVVEKTLKLYPYSPIATCASVGFDDKKCLDAYKHVTTSNYSSNKSDKNDIVPELDEFFNKIEKARLPKIETALKSAHLKYSKTKKTADLMTIISLNDQMIRYVCADMHSSYSNDCKTCNDEENKIKNIDFFAGIDTNKKDKKNQEKTSEIVDRIIYLSDDCEDFLESTSKFEPMYPNPICKEKGEYSPSCLTALINWKKYIIGKYKAEKDAKKDVKIMPQQNEPIFESF